MSYEAITEISGISRQKLLKFIREEKEPLNTRHKKGIKLEDIDEATIENVRHLVNALEEAKENDEQ